MPPPAHTTHVSTISSRMCAKGRNAMKVSEAKGFTTFWEKMEATRPTKFLCVSMTPFGRPVDPEVYMMNARSSGPGAYGSTSAGLSLPAATRASNVVEAASPILGSASASSGDGNASALVIPPTVVSGMNDLPMMTMWRRDATFASTFSFSSLYCCQSMKITVASVSFRPCSIASWPRVVYTVVMGIESWYIAWADMCHSAEVSARIAPMHVVPDSFLSLMADRESSPLAAALTLSPTSA
mmetsp:Transcript_9755/g.26463  ORF Transcript_9755/g.26463 Transcript_9755/m.26463 type:complete len:240 (-) Transcript_9755:98-817(-)